MEHSLIKLRIFVQQQQRKQRKIMKSNTLTAAERLIADCNKQALVSTIIKGINEQEGEFKLKHDPSVSLDTEGEFTVYIGDMFVYAKVSGGCDDYGFGSCAYVETLKVIDESNNTIELTDEQSEQVKKVIRNINVAYA